MKRRIVFSMLAALTGCGVETAGTAATGAAVKQKEIEAGNKSMEQARQQIDQAAQQIRERADKAGEQ